MAHPDLARGRRHLRALAAGGILLWSASMVGIANPGDDPWTVAGGILEFAALFLAACALMYRGSRWPRPLVAALFWLTAGFCVFVFMMAGGPLMFTASATARAQGTAVVAAFVGYVMLALLAGSSHLRAFIDARRAARRAAANA